MNEQQKASTNLSDLIGRMSIRKEQFERLAKKPQINEVKMKIGTCNQSGFSVLIYLTSAFVSGRLLDSGLSYSLDYQERDGSVLCKLSYFDIVSEEMMHVKDVGVTTQNRGQANQTIKSGFSDSTKRAFSRLAGNPFSGMPNIWVYGKTELKNNKYVPKRDFDPSTLNIVKMEFIGTQCSTLMIVDKFGDIVFEYENHVLIQASIPQQDELQAPSEPQPLVEPQLPQTSEPQPQTPVEPQPQLPVEPQKGFSMTLVAPTITKELGIDEGNIASAVKEVMVHLGIAKNEEKITSKHKTQLFRNFTFTEFENAVKEVKKTLTPTEERGE